METKTLNCGCIQTLIDRQGTVEAWTLSSECAAHQAERAQLSVNLAKDRRRNEILTTLRENDFKVIRSITEGDSARIAAHQSAQAALRSELNSL